jgi:hypothetical protein
MLSLACFVAVGLVLGFLVPLRAFALLSLLALAAYAALSPGFSGLGRIYDSIFAWIALQLGYFLASSHLRCAATPFGTCEQNNR